MAANSGVFMVGLNHGNVGADAGGVRYLVASGADWQTQRSSPRSAHAVSGEHAHEDDAQHSSGPNALNAKKECVILQLGRGEHSISKKKQEEDDDVIPLGSDLTL